MEILLSHSKKLVSREVGYASLFYQSIFFFVLADDELAFLAIDFCKQVEVVFVGLSNVFCRYFSYFISSNSMTI